MRTDTLFVAILLMMSVLLEAKTIKVPQDHVKIQSAIDASVDGDTVLISEGTYVENLRIFKKIVVGSEFMLDNDTSHISKTIIDGGSQTKADSGSAVYFGVPSDTTTVIVGLTITKGKGTLVPESATRQWYFGGGVCVQSKGAKIIHNRIIQNSLSYLSSNKYALGGGIGTWYSIASDNWYIIEDNLIADNSISGVQAEAAGISVVGNARIQRNSILHNTAVAPAANFAAGGIAITGHPTNVIQCNNNIIKTNYSSRNGGGIYIYRPTPAGGPTVQFSNNLIVQNKAERAGAGLFIGQGSTITMVNNTVADNVCPGAGAGMVIPGIATDHATVRGINNIFWNSGNLNNEIYGADFESFYHNLIREEQLIGENNFIADPLFLNDGSYRLSDASPCIGGGVVIKVFSGDVTLSAPAKDYYGNDRSQPGGSPPDIGAVESALGTTTAARTMRSELVKFNHQSYNRYCIVLRPKGRENLANNGLLINLHGYDGTASELMNYLLMHEVGDSLGFVSAFPEGYQRRWNSGINENASWPTPANDDVAYLSALIDTLHARYNIDTNRVYVTGYSNGGFMCMKLAAQLAHRLRSVAAINSVISAGTAASYAAQGDIPILMMNGTADATVPYNGGVSGWYSTPSTLDFWRDKFEVTLQVDTTIYPDVNPSDLSTVERYRYYNSAGKRMLWFYKVVGGSHAWPGATPYPGVRENKDISARWEIYNFINDPFTSVKAKPGIAPSAFLLSQNFPNPFNPSTDIQFSLPQKRQLTLIIFDLLGREVATLVNEELSAGTYTIRWDATGFSSGVYFYRLQAREYLDTKRLILLR